MIEREKVRDREKVREREIIKGTRPSISEREAENNRERVRKRERERVVDVKKLFLNKSRKSRFPLSLNSKNRPFWNK